MINENTALKIPFLLAHWSEDAGEVSWRVCSYLKKHFSFKECAEIDPLGFFSLGGVEIKKDILCFPQAKFYSIDDQDLLVFQGSQPYTKRYRFLTTILDIAEKFNLQGVYTVGGIVSMIPHTNERKMIAIVNAPELKEGLAGYDLDMGLDYQGNASMSGFLLWVARERKIPAVSFWVNVPFYLTNNADPKANKAMLSFLNQRFGMGVDLKELDKEIEIQEERISRLRKNNQEVDEYIARLELNVGLSQQEVEKLAEEVSRAMM